MCLMRIGLKIVMGLTVKTQVSHVSFLLLIFLDIGYCIVQVNVVFELPLSDPQSDIQFQSLHSKQLAYVK